LKRDTDEEYVTHAALVEHLRQFRQEGVVFFHPSIDSLKGFKFVITNLPYKGQDVLGAHLVALGARDGCSIALLTRAEWIVARARRDLVHEHPNFAGVLHLTSRPRWSEIAIASPRHNFIWAVWSAAPRPPGAPPWVQFADRNRERRG
jgi:hypothetical protein